ncbi:hypothetical protein ACKLNO_05590 [Neisseriaceae bacterium B1]
MFRMDVSLVFRQPENGMCSVCAVRTHAFCDESTRAWLAPHTLLKMFQAA